MREPFSILSLFMGGPRSWRLRRRRAIFTDDRLWLEFTAPREIHRRTPATTRQPRGAARAGGGPAFIADATPQPARAVAQPWGDDGEGGRVSRMAYDDFVRALTLDPGDTEALDGLVRAAVFTNRGTDALAG